MLSQSAGATQATPSTQGAQSAPPQSTSVSLTFVTVLSAQSVGARHSTRHRCRRRARHCRRQYTLSPAAEGVLRGEALLQVSSVHGFSSSSTSVSSGSAESVPWPSHEAVKQSPSTCSLAAPAGAKVNPHTPPSQVRVWQRVSTPSQSVGAVHCTPPPSTAPRYKLKGACAA